MATVSAPPRARRERPAAPSPAPAAPPERHGTCSLTLRIGGTEYALRPCPPPPGLEVVRTLRKLEGPRPVAYAVASDGAEVHCTCPDHEHNRTSCKHMMSLTALRLIPRPARPAAPAEAPAPPVAASPADEFRSAVKKEVARLGGAPSPGPAPWETSDTLPEGWQRGGASPPAPSPAPARRPARPKAPKCLECGRPIVAPSPDPAFCDPCFRTISGEGGGR
jgi:hypothetical protein